MNNVTHVGNTWIVEARDLGGRPTRTDNGFLDVSANTIRCE